MPYKHFTPDQRNELSALLGQSKEERYCQAIKKKRGKHLAGIKSQQLGRSSLLNLGFRFPRIILFFCSQLPILVTLAFH